MRDLKLLSNISKRDKRGDKDKVTATDSGDLGISLVILNQIG